MSCLFGFLVYDDRLLSILPTLYSKVILHAGSELFFDVQKNIALISRSVESNLGDRISRGGKTTSSFTYINVS